MYILHTHIYTHTHTLCLYFITSRFPHIPYGGFGGAIAGSSIALKQLLPDYEIKLFGLVGIRGKVRMILHY